MCVIFMQLTHPVNRFEWSATTDMAEQNTATKPQHTTGTDMLYWIVYLQNIYSSGLNWLVILTFSSDVKEEDMDHVSACNEHKQEDIDISLNAKKQHSEGKIF